LKIRRRVIANSEFMLSILSNRLLMVLKIILSLTNRVIVMMLNISFPEITDNKLDNEFRFSAEAGIIPFSTISGPGANRRLFLQG
jgi:hypothetical protein